MRHFVTGEELNFSTIKELREFLQLQNPTALRHYASELNRLNPLLIVDGVGTELTIKKIKQ